MGFIGLFVLWHTAHKFGGATPSENLQSKALPIESTEIPLLGPAFSYHARYNGATLHVGASVTSAVEHQLPLQAIRFCSKQPSTSTRE